MTMTRRSSMIFFRSDYSSGAHPRILEALSKTNYEHSDGYFMDDHCFHAIELLKKKIGRDDVDIHLTVGGTITNLTAICAFLRPHQAAVSAASGHICMHETGSVEATGHKVIHLPSTDGKVRPEQIDETVIFHEDEHMVQPKLLYISQPTEIGTIYKKAELAALKAKCEEHGMYLYIDGARLATALTCDECDVTLSDMAKYSDAFYIGGTKNAFLFGEALVIVNPALKEDFRFIIKQRGGMFAKGRLIGIQFEEMFKDELYFEIGRGSNEKAAKLREGIKAAGYKFMVDSPTNQIFPIFPEEMVKRLEKDFFFYRWAAPKDGMTPIRLVTSWVTTDEDIKAFLDAIK